ncbi:MAG: divergent polysaccharide deacetylase family protein [Candidatus Cloacimonetes bacterium]|nr:divergent polysaccharide deacetylase family protein [Candidatus Cloacimonadota bacterium]
MAKRNLLIIIIVLLFWGCNKHTRETEVSVPMDRVILTAAIKIGIDTNTVQRTQRNGSIYYTIPVKDFKEIDETDIEIKRLAKDFGLSYRGVISSSRNRLRNAYWSPADDQYAIVEIFQKETPRFTMTINPPNMPLLCIIIDDFGQYNGPLLDSFCLLDKAVAFAVIPGLPFSNVAIDKAIKSGREVIVHIPMEADSNANPGNNAIFSHLNEREIYHRMNIYFDNNKFAIGGNNHMGSKITSNKRLLRSVFRYMQEHDYYFIDSKTTPNSVVREIALEMGVAYESRDLFLDAPDSTDAVLYDCLRELQRLKNNKNRALVITHCFDKGRLQRLQIFINEAKKMGFQLVPPSQYVIKGTAV